MSTMASREALRFSKILASAAITLVVLSVGTAEAARPATGVLMNKSQTVRWNGGVARANVPPGEIPECAATTCDRFDLVVDLPRGAWVRMTGGVEVSIRWGGVGNNLGLYVYRGGKRVAASDQGLAVATAASVLIPEAADGTYSVYAVFDRSSADDRIFYQGVAEVERPPKAKPVRPLLPDLAVRPQQNPTFETPFVDFFEPLPPPGESCFPSEAAEQGAETCLRFDTLFANVGEGPLEMRFAIPRDPAADARTISQRIYRSDAENDYLVQGITPGWGDLYDWFLPDQYIEVTGVPDGVYLLETIADPDNTILEANESNNCGSAYVRLSNVASSPTAELLGPGLPCSRPGAPRLPAAHRTGHAG